MLKKIILLFLLLCGTRNITNAQQVSLDTYARQLYFNIFSSHPDTAISDFIRSYAPSLLNSNNTIAPGNTTGEDIRYEIHSFLFTKHPYFKPTFTNGKLELYCMHNSRVKSTQVYDVKLWFEFDTQPEAEMAFSKLAETLIPISTQKQFSSANGYQKGAFTDSKGEKGFNRLQIRLTADNLDRRRLKILIELQNDLP